jgi:hypothetical protein
MSDHVSYTAVPDRGIHVAFVSCVLANQCVTGVSLRAPSVGGKGLGPAGFRRTGWEGDLRSEAESVAAPSGSQPLTGWSIDLGRACYCGRRARADARGRRQG